MQNIISGAKIFYYIEFYDKVNKTNLNIMI